MLSLILLPQKISIIFTYLLDQNSQNFEFRELNYF
jgi:hypothetical protein